MIFTIARYDGQLFAHNDRRQGISSTCFNSYEKAAGW